MPDMWYLEGTFESNSNELAIEFRKIVSKFNGKEVIIDPTKGIRALLEVENKEKINITVICLDNDLLFVRRVFKKEAVEWLLGNVPEIR